MNFNLILTEKNNNIFNIILNDQKNQNTLSENMINELTSALDIADKDNEVKVIILSSKGNIFCAGHNLKDLNSQRLQNDKGESYFKKIFQMCSQLMLKINKNNKPVIAMVDGIATAAGCQLISSCDLAYSSSRAKYATPGVNIGLFCSTPMVPLSRTVGKKQAMEMLLTGDLIDANKALRIGLINNVFEEDSLKEKVRLATILGTYQATLTDFKYLRKIWQKTTEEERLLGVSLTGIMDNVLTNGTKDTPVLAQTLDEL